MGKIIMGYWNCKFCNKTHIAGSERDCPSCGHPRPDGTKFYMDGTKAVDNKTAEIVKARGQDWTCSACDCLNSGLDDTCEGCGAPRIKQNNSPVNPIYDGICPTHNAESRSYGTITNNAVHNDTNTNIMPIKNRKKIDIKRWALITGIVVLSLALITGLIFLFIPKPLTVTITDYAWEYNIDIEKLTTVNESDWYLPSGARLLYTQQEVHHYDDVFDHYEDVPVQVPDGYDEITIGYRDLGNGYFEEITSNKPRYKTEMSQKPVTRKEPQYQTKYYYEIDKWLHNRTITTSGHDKDPYWGEVILHDKEREGSRKTTYTICGKDTKDKYRTLTVSYDIWLNCKTGDTVSGKVDIFGNFKPND